MKLLGWLLTHGRAPRFHRARIPYSGASGQRDWASDENSRCGKVGSGAPIHPPRYSGFAAGFLLRQSDQRFRVGLAGARDNDLSFGFMALDRRRT